jgi:hypothetical protein
LIEAGMKVEAVIGDEAYSEKGNIEYTKENEIKLVAKLNPVVTQGNRKKEDEFVEKCKDYPFRMDAIQRVLKVKLIPS